MAPSGTTIAYTALTHQRLPDDAPEFIISVAMMPESNGL